MNIKIVKDKISIAELQEIAQEFYITMIKGVVDIEKEIQDGDTRNKIKTIINSKIE